MKTALLFLVVLILLIGCENPSSSSAQPYKTMIIDLGAWNMMTTVTKLFSYTDYGIPGRDSILAIFPLIRADTGAYIPLEHKDFGYYYIHPTEIWLIRTDAGDFNSDAFDDDTISRGTLTVYYRE